LAGSRVIHVQLSDVSYCTCARSYDCNSHHQETSSQNSWRKAGIALFPSSFGVGRWFILPITSSSSSF
jgi:hypothetical protein